MTFEEELRDFIRQVEDFRERLDRFMEMRDDRLPGTLAASQVGYLLGRLSAPLAGLKTVTEAENGPCPHEKAGGGCGHPEAPEKYAAPDGCERARTDGIACPNPRRCW